MVGPWSSTSILGTQQKCRYQDFHHDTATAATTNMPHDVHCNIARKTGSSTNINQDEVWSEYILNLDIGSHLTIYLTAGEHQDDHDQYIAVCTGKPPCATKACVYTVWEIENHDLIQCKSTYICARLCRVTYGNWEDMVQKVDWSDYRCTCIGKKIAGDPRIVASRLYKHCITQPSTRHVPCRDIITFVKCRPPGLHIPSQL